MNSKKEKEKIDLQTNRSSGGSIWRSSVAMGGLMGSVFCKMRMLRRKNIIEYNRTLIGRRRRKRRVVGGEWNEKKKRKEKEREERSVVVLPWVELLLWNGMVGVVSYGSGPHSLSAVLTIPFYLLFKHSLLSLQLITPLFLTPTLTCPSDNAIHNNLLLVIKCN